MTTYTVVERQVHPSFPVPYRLVLVKLDVAPGVRLLGHLDGRQELSPGTTTEASMTELGPGVFASS